MDEKSHDREVKSEACETSTSSMPHYPEMGMYPKPMHPDAKRSEPDEAEDKACETSTSLAPTHVDAGETLGRAQNHESSESEENEGNNKPASPVGAPPQLSAHQRSRLHELL